MRQYITRRIIQSSVMLFALSIAVFLLLRIAPGADPARLRCGLMCQQERYEALRAEMHLDDSYPVQYGRWARQLVTGSLGHDWNGGSVSNELRHRLPVTAELMIITVLATVIVGIPFGILSAIFRNSPIDYVVRFTAITALAIPSFWLATLVLLVPQQMWNYAPPITATISLFDNPLENLRQFVPPSLIMGTVASASVMRLTRSAMLEVMWKDYIRTARAKGLTERSVISRHALKNSLIPVVTVVGLQIAGLFGGAIIIENVFNLKGVGSYFLDALMRKDFQVAQTLTLYVGTVVVAINLAVDIVYAWLDPRIRYT